MDILKKLDLLIFGLVADNCPDSAAHLREASREIERLRAEVERVKTFPDRMTKRFGTVVGDSLGELLTESEESGY